ncbi:MAG TPA: hypothetical protein VKZ79_12005 [Alphaproteobacteria bacterium]|nr:hypothetical protein [Alphaproteobacteria bacterium]
MSKIMGLAAAVALFAGVSAFAQNSDTSGSSAAPPAASSDTSAAPADTSSDASKSEMKGMHHRHHRHHGQQARNSAASDYDADKLNACHVSANPTPEQEQCLHQAETPS